MSTQSRTDFLVLVRKQWYQRRVREYRGNTMTNKPSAADFTWKQVLGEGAFGDVVLATENATGVDYAVKKMLKSHLSKESNKKFVMNERNVLSICNHPSIVKLHKAFRDDQYFYYVLSLAPNGELLGVIRKNKGLDLEITKFWAAEIVSALEYLHLTAGVIHRDLKPENVLLDEKYHVLITDFGTSKIVSQEEGREARKGSFVGTAEYMPPELVKDTKSCFASDLWSLGCTIYHMLCARPPFRGITDYLTMQKVQEGIKAVVYPDPFPDVARDLIEKLLCLDPAERIGVADNFVGLKSHPFFSGITWQGLHLQTPPSIAPSPPLRWQEDIIREEQELLRKQREELRTKWEKFLFKDPQENIVESGMVIKARKLSKKRRFMILTDTPRIFYVDPKKMDFKGEIPWGDEKRLKIEVKNDVEWRVVIANRIYFLEDLSKNAQRWKEAVEKLQKDEP
eukprot:TRINITY_DN3094_c0_g1_i5.p1 TRINITY_DN3094_c0_g1~~TRINITY_DN3094_c0_g1_i5.p1  ORF type:complete len:453 (-),score=94.70 TRINITY_DN3094_c0_g1_i5:254-1612(-)